MDLNPIPGRPALYDPYFITTEVEKIRSQSVLYRVIKDLGLRRNGSNQFRWNRRKHFNT